MHQVLFKTPILVLIFFSLLILFVVHSTYATEKDAVDFIHKPLSNETITPPGTPLTLSFSLSNTRKADLRARIFLVLDGVGSVIKMKNLLLDEQDRPKFEITVPSPKSSISYFFSIYSYPEPLLSKRFVFQRTCLPESELKSDEELDKVPLQGKAQLLSQQAQILDNQISAYNQSIALLNEIKNILGNEKW